MASCVSSLIGSHHRTPFVYCTDRSNTCDQVVRPCQAPTHDLGVSGERSRWRCRNESRSRTRFPQPGDVDGRRVVITGAGRGLGELIAHAFSTAGAKVALVARTERDLKEVADALPGPTLVFSGDVRDADFNESVADGVVAEWGGVDVWICNAGISPIVTGPLDISAEVWRDVIDVNLTGAFLGARAAARVMERGGRVIFTGSVLGERPRKGLTAYSASKAGLVGMAKGLALDLAPVGDHRQRRVARMVRVAARRRVRQQRAAGGGDPVAHGAATLGAVDAT